MNETITYPMVRQLVIGLQTTGLKGAEQLQRMKAFQCEYADGKMSPEAKDYLQRQVQALTEFCS